MEKNKLEQSDLEFLSALGSISEAVAKENDLIGDENVYLIQGKVKRITDSLAEIKSEGRLLKIGIIGCVKAGKSSFLNALVFNGDEILPKAPTPMTAALTKIGYSAVPEAKIVFYKKYDWQNIKSMSERYTLKVDEEYKVMLQQYHAQQAMEGAYAAAAIPPSRDDAEKSVRCILPEELVASHELVAMATANGLDVDKILGTEEVITGDPQESPAEYIKKLETYVGAGGKYTPLFNHIELVIKNQILVITVWAHMKTTVICTMLQ